MPSAHISKLHKTPSVLTDVPPYPNTYLAFNKKIVYEENMGPYHPKEGKKNEVIKYEQSITPENEADDVFYQEDNKLMSCVHVSQLNYLVCYLINHYKEYGCMK
ncbi:unnamed protein product [Lupinus luteus]|uniref:Uncharacterized protein n=1 Tax=Lupinus luteus TaxID=3873 RepID=A0AAV1WC89_LUPLU